MANENCAFGTIESRRRIFWTTQPDACENYTDCGADCGVPGLKFSGDDSSDQMVTGRTFMTNDWLRSLMINILMTDGRRPNTDCGYRPGAQGGHWSESYRSDGQAIGTLLRTAPTEARIRDSMNTVKAYAQSSLQRLVDLGVAISVEVDAQYLGGNRMSLNISAIGPAGDRARVGVSGSRLENGWVWQ